MHHDTYRIALQPIEFFRQSEAVDPEAVRLLADTISAAGAWTTAVPVEHESGIVMDGNHRLCAARLLGLKRLPCILLSYHDPRVTVTHWWSAEPFAVERIFDTVLAHREMLSYKTTRHRFTPSLPGTDIALATLRAHEPLENLLLANSSLYYQDEIQKYFTNNSNPIGLNHEH